VDVCTTRLALVLALLCADPASAQGVLPIRTLTPTIVAARGALGGPFERFYFADEQTPGLSSAATLF